MLLTPNERRVAEGRRDCYWLYVVTSCLPASRGTAQADATKPRLQEPITDPVRFLWSGIVNAQQPAMSLRDLRSSAQ
jgi:hypothetical protein